MATAVKTLTVPDRRSWRKWLARHHDRGSEVWLIFTKDATRKTPLSYDDAVEEALCFGWVDSLIRRIDEREYARKFTPRKPDSKWSSTNRKRYEKLEAAGLLAPAGRERRPTDRSGDTPKLASSKVPAYIEVALRASPSAWRFFEQLAPSYRRLYIVWIESAKKEETKRRRLAEAVATLEQGQKLGLK
jgi:uncharacterized protein YdeI (YjbR/CyaY-like superfamily)